MPSASAIFSEVPFPRIPAAKTCLSFRLYIRNSFLPVPPPWQLLDSQDFAPVKIASPGASFSAANAGTAKVQLKAS